MLAPCHSAVDNMLGKILQNGHKNIVRLGHPACTSFPEMCLANRAKQLNQTEKFILHEAQVVFGPGAGSLKTELRNPDKHENRRRSQFSRWRPGKVDEPQNILHM